MLRAFVLMLMSVCFLAACDASGKITPESVAAEIAKDCGIVVTIADIAALIAQQPGVTGVAVFAKQVCDAFNAKKAQTPQAANSGVLSVQGVPVHYTKK